MDLNGMRRQPAEWQTKRLDEITNTQKPISYGIVQTGKPIHNGVKCIRVVDIKNGRINPEDLITTSEEISTAYKRTILSTGDLVIALRGKIGEIALIEPALAGSNLTRGVALISPTDEVDSEYLLHYLSSAESRRVFEKNLNGSALQEIPIAALRAITAAIPNKVEQRGIASVLSDMDALLAKLDQLIAKKRDIKQAAMQELLTGKRRLPGVSGEWKHTSIGEVCEVKTGPFGSSLHESDYVKEGTPIITVEHLGEFGVTYQNLPLVSKQDWTRLREYTLEAGDIVFSRVGSVDRNALIKPTEDGWLFSGRLLRVRVKSKNALASFLSHQFHLESFKKKVREVAVGQTMASINTQILKNIQITLPPTDEQAAIALIISEMNTEVIALEARREKTRRLKQGMMQELLSGRVRLI